VEKDDLKSENVCRIYVKVQASLGTHDRVHELSKLNIDMKVGNMSSYTREAQWHVCNTGAMLDERVQCRTTG
jgi:hypothetical protein